MSAVFASADQIARAVVAAARLVGADPIEALLSRDASGQRGNPAAHARLLAFAGVRIALPGIRDSALARGLNFAYKGSVAVQKIQNPPSWWREDWVNEIVGAILAPEIEPELGGAVEVLPEPPASSPPPAPPRKRVRAAPLDLGEPEPGRSALDRRRSGAVAAGEDEEPQDRRRQRAPVSLPRLKFLEKGAEP
jgi:hypothetical protein